MLFSKKEKKKTRVMECGEGGGVRMGEAQNLALRSLSELLKSNTEPSGKMSEDRSVVKINL